MALHTDTAIYRATYELARLVTQLVSNMPRNYKADFGAELRRRCMGLVMRTYEANTAEADERPTVLRRMRHEVEAVNLSLRLAVVFVFSCLDSCVEWRRSLRRCLWPNF